MKRDMNLARRILFALEKKPLNEILSPEDIQDVSEQEVSYHIMLLAEAGLLKTIDGSSASDIYIFASRLTWEGHEFLDAARDDSRWEKAKKMVTEKGGGLAFDVLKEVLIKLMTQAVFGGNPAS